MKRSSPSVGARLGMESLESREVPALVTGLTNTGVLVRFDSATPAVITPIAAVTGLNAGQTLVGIDYRPLTGQLYGLGLNDATDTAQLYTINPATAVATAVGTSFTLAGTAIGFDFNPIPDLIRVTTDADVNLRLNPNTGAIAGTDTNITPAAGNTIVGLAYDRNFPATTQTTLYGYDFSDDTLVTIGSVNGTPQSPNTGAVNLIGGSGIVTSGSTNVGFDIGQDGVALLNGTVGGNSGLYTVNLTTGAATLVGNFPVGTIMSDIAVPVANNGGGVGAVAVGPNVTITRNGTTSVVTPFAGFTGAVSVGLGDVNSDFTNDVIVGASVSGHVKAFDGTTGAEIRSFFPFIGYTGGTYVAGGDISGDGVDDIIVGATINGHVKVFDGVTGAEIRSFLAYVNFAGEARVGSGDIDGDGRDDIITGAGSGAFGHVKVFSGVDNAEIRSFLAYVNFNGGIFVAGDDVNRDGRDDIVTGAEANGHVKVFSGVDNSELRSFFAFPGFLGSARVAARDVNRDGAADLIVGQGPGGNALVRTFDGLTLTLLAEVTLSDPLNQGIFVG